MSQSEEGSIEVDVFDKQILFHLSKERSHGFPIHPFFRAIDNRKSNLKRLLKVESLTAT
jgi:hypothetical protein